MSTHLEEKEEKIERLLESLAEESSKEIPVVVEGKKDVETLRALNVDGKIITLKAGGKSFLNVLSDLEKLGVQEVILLLDFDRRGKEATKRLKLRDRAKITVNVTKDTNESVDIDFWVDRATPLTITIQKVNSTNKTA